MTQQYSQAVEVRVPPARKRMQWIGIALILFSAGFAVAAGIFSWYFVFGAIPFIVLGAIDLHVYNLTSREYIYDFSPKRLVIAKKDIVNRTRRMLNILFEDVREVGLFDDMLDDADFVAVDDPYAKGVWQMNFTLDGKVARLLFAPDTYMQALLKELLGDKYRDQNN